MTIDSAFWVAVSFFIFLGILIFFKVPQKVRATLEENILNIKNQITEAEKLKEETKNMLSENEKKISNSKLEVKSMLNKANEEAEKMIIKKNEEFHYIMENRKKNAEERAPIIKYFKPLSIE